MGKLSFMQPSFYHLLLIFCPHSYSQFYQVMSQIFNSITAGTILQLSFLFLFHITIMLALPPKIISPCGADVSFHIVLATALQPEL